MVGPDDLNLNSDAQDAGPKRVSNFPSYFALKRPVAGLLLSLIPRLEKKMPTLKSVHHNFHGTFELDPSLAGGHPALFPPSGLSEAKVPDHDPSRPRCFHDR